MTTIREVRCSDLLEITHMTMGRQTGMGSLGELMFIMTKFPKYSLVCVSPGNRITGFVVGVIEGKGVEKHCMMNEMHFPSGSAEIFHKLMKAIEERAEVHKMYYVEVDMISDYQKYVELLKEMGYTCHKEYFDVIQGELVNKSILRKHFVR